ncbi:MULTISPECIES: PDR/VanB family oxidoreductase [unclassified Burkholderia]|uniref:PDR/VanB family oxidoreductase n=1 Tax=unclassified Burkholderia TaxID=2613784 RepID=UPI000F58C0D0|nr:MULTISPECIES: PDR/VanB family oxidoreductase [unclassified Burkholderia]RQR70964.1 oxidoreductase [Burkholderia sp. Bp9011]RQR83727.1 oxidoreductase [Burkholderia sp. Bp9010]RQS64428.1 oxidoreductase [Burkholderia sp. Bp8977]
MIEVVVTRVTRLAEGIVGVELRKGNREALPNFEPGAHIDVHLPGGIVRQYSLCNTPTDLTRYCLGVSRSATSRGGSAYIHDSLQVGDRLVIGEPRSLFAMSRDAMHHNFIAGGIGITPILSMIRACVEGGFPWRLTYCVRSRNHAAYLEEILSLNGDVHLHVDDEAAEHVNVGAVLSRLRPAEHVYCCGPEGLMAAVEAQGKSLELEPSRVHFERFGAAMGPQALMEGSSFTVVLARTGKRCLVESGESILECLERNGVAPPFACREGLCRSCEVPLISGEVEHRDYVLSTEEQRAGKSLMICVSRARTPEIAIDL